MSRASAPVETTEQVTLADAFDADVVEALRTVTNGTVLAAYSLVAIKEKRAATAHDAVGGILTLLEFKPSASKRRDVAGSGEDIARLWLVIRKPTRFVTASDVADAQRKLQSVAFNSQKATFRSCPLRRLVTRRVIRGSVCESDKKCSCAARVLAAAASGWSDTDASESPSRTPRVRRRLFVTRFVEPASSASGGVTGRTKTTEDGNEPAQVLKTTEATHAPSRRLAQQKSAPASSSAWQSAAAVRTTSGPLHSRGHAHPPVALGQIIGREPSEPRKMPPVSRGVLMAMQRREQQELEKHEGSTPSASKGKQEVQWIRQWDSAARRFYWYNQESAESRWVRCKFGIG